MPIPFLFIGAAIATGAFGAGKSIKAGVDQKDANDTNERADSIVKGASKMLTPTSVLASASFNAIP